MNLTEAEMGATLKRFEGLVFSTAQRLVRQGVEADREDIEQLLRVKIWKAIRAYDPAKTKMPLERYAFMCAFDQAKDIAKRKKRGELFIEDVAPSSSDEDAPTDRFHERYLSADHSQVYGDVDDGELHLPNTLTERELSVLTLMRESYRQTEIAVELHITKREVESAVRGIRTKLADWRPSNSQVEADESCPSVLAA